MSTIEKTVNVVRKRARAKRAQIFLQNFTITRDTKILDIGSENGSSIASVLQGTEALPENVYIADINKKLLEEGRTKFGFVPILISESGTLPFEDRFFDLVYCSSVIEHVTVPKEQVWTMGSGREFLRVAAMRQASIAHEIRRLGKGYFVQTPNKWFLIESHTWLPFVGYLPRRVLVPLLRITNRYWIKRTSPDWRLLTFAEMRKLFPDAVIKKEKLLGMTKSIMAIKIL
jgi:ubiquinone/menaquinone biosynthesis C-methylase UbiE